MKRIVSIIALFSLVLNCTFTPRREVRIATKDPVVVSDRVGEKIDSDERVYFDLFVPEIYIKPLTYRYDSATFYAIPGGGYELRVSATPEDVMVVNKDDHGIDILADYLNNYEAISESKQMFEEKWGIVDYDHVGLPITKHEIESTRKHIIAMKMASSKRSALGVGPGIGGCLGGLAAYGIIKAAGWGTHYEINDPGVEGAFALLEWLAILGVAATGIALGTLAGFLIGRMAASKAPGSSQTDIDELTIINTIKEQRLPRVAGK